MKIGIIGSGNIGGNAARLFVKAGHEVAISNSRGPESLRDFIAELGPKAHAETAEGAAAFGEIVLVAIPWRNREDLPDPKLVAGKIVIDATNPYAPDFSVYDLGDSTSSEEVLKLLPGARFVKAFNTIQYKDLASQGRTGLPLEERRAIFVAGDDQDAKRVVARLIEEIGFAPVDTGSLNDGGKKQQPNMAIYNKYITAKQAREMLSAQVRPAA